MPCHRVLLPLVALASAAFAHAGDVPACAAEESSENCELASGAVAAAPLAADGADAGESLALAQRQIRSLLAPRKGGRHASAAVLPSVVFVKTHKTGGSTMANIMNRLVYDRDLKKVPTNDGHVINWPMLLEQEAPNHQYDIVCNHQMLNMSAVKAYTKTSPFIFTILREPLSMIDSKFRWKVSRHAKDASESDTWAKRLVEMHETPNLYMNSLSRDLGWYDGMDIRHDGFIEGEATFRNDKDPEAISKFVQYIDSSMDLVFMTERYDEGLVLLRRDLGLDMKDVSYLRMKESSVAADAVPPPTEAEMEQLKEFIGVDTALYEHFSKRFWKQWEEHGGNATLLLEVTALRERNAELERECGNPGNSEKCWEFQADGGYFDAMLDVKDS